MFSITCPPATTAAVWMIMPHILLHSRRGFDFSRQAGRKQRQKKTIWCNFASSRPAGSLLGLTSDIWGVEWAESHQEAELSLKPRWNGSSAKGPISQHIYSTGSLPATAAVGPGFTWVVFYYICFLVVCCLLQTDKFWLFIRLERDNLKICQDDFFPQKSFFF